jgi:hypothetical protein
MRLKDVEIAYAMGVLVGFAVAMIAVGLVTAWCL